MTIRILSRAEAPVSWQGDSAVIRALPAGFARIRWDTFLRYGALALIALLSSGTAIAAAQLTIDDGVVVKFGADAGLRIHDGLQTGRHAVLTSVRDDTAAGQTGAFPGAAIPGDWLGVTVERTAAIGRLNIDRLEIRYAGRDGAAALQVEKNYSPQYLKIVDSLVGIRVINGASPYFSGLSLLRNQTGLESANSSPSVTASEISGNGLYGINNLTPGTRTVGASNNWWGSAGGPTIESNPGGLGDNVSAGVEFGSYRTSVPLIDCSIEAADGIYSVVQPQVSLVLECRNALEYRLSSSSNFGSAPYQAMTPRTSFRLMANGNVYAQFRTQGSNSVVASSPWFTYMPDAPAITILTPAENEILAGDDVLISARVTDSVAVERVDFSYIDKTQIERPIGSVQSGAGDTYETLWSLTNVPDEAYVLKILAVNTRSVTAAAVRNVRIRRPGSDTQGPQILDIKFNGLPLTSGATLHASGTLSFAASDPSGIGQMSVSLDGELVPHGLQIDDRYSVWLDLDSIEAGPHTITLAATDTWNNGSETSLDIDVDTAPIVDAPIVGIMAPAAGASVQADVTIRATVTGDFIRQVNFYVDNNSLGSVSAPPYEMPWFIGGFTTGAHELKVVAVNSAGLTGQDSRTVAITRPAGESDTIGPSIQNVRYGGTPVEDGMTLRDSAVLTFSATDVSGVASVAVRFDATTIPSSASGSTYSASLSLAGAADGLHTLTLKAVDSLGNASEIAFSLYVDRTPPPPGPPSVAITSPSLNATLTTNTEVAASVLGTDVRRVDFYADTQWIGSAAAEPYAATWNVAGFGNGSHTLKAVATDGLGQTGMASRSVQLDQVSNDTTGPTIGTLSLAGRLLAEGDHLTAAGLLTFSVADESGVLASGVTVSLGSTVLGGGGLNSGRYSVLLDPAVVIDGTYDLTVLAVDRLGNQSSSVVQGLVVDIPLPPVPSILVPNGAGTTTARPQVAVSGTAQAGSRVQLRMDGASTGSPITATFNGTFAGTVTLPMEGATYALTATAQNARGTSAASAEVPLTYVAPSPTVLITQPLANAVIDTSGAAQTAVPIQASVTDVVGISGVTLSVDGQQIGSSLTRAPYAWTWTATPADEEGEHQLVVVATNGAGKSTSAERTVTLRHTPPPPPPPQTAYTGRVQSITDLVSHGEQPILISGSAIDTATGDKVPNALLKVVLQVGGFQRRIGTSSDANGDFALRFVPQDSDAGIYTVSVIHPDQTTLPNQGQFTIDRLTLSPTRYALQAIRTVPTTIRITAKASDGNGASGVRLVVVDEDQSSGHLPAGITIQPQAPVNLGPGASAALDIAFTASLQAAEPSGTVVLRVKDGSGSDRGRIAINYTLRDPQPSLVPQPKSVLTSVGKNAQVLESVLLKNQGYTTATGIQVELYSINWSTRAISPPPPWVESVGPDVTALDAGQSATWQVIARPTSEVQEGVHSLVMRVSYANGTGGDVPVTISVTPDCSQGQATCEGGTLLHVSDIYTKTQDEQGNEIPGVRDALIRLQRESDYVTVASLRTNADGEVEVQHLPIGHYRYLASAPNHVSASGRITVRAGLSTVEEIFLDYELVSFEWSVTETTITDHYDVTLTATYQTQVPAPVILIQPASINLPDMQEGEEMTGEITIINRGLVRADNLVWYPAESDSYHEFVYMGTPPESLGAGESVRIPYKVTKKSEPLPGLGVRMLKSAPGSSAGPAFQSVKSGVSTTAGTCHTYRRPMHVEFGYECAAGVERSGQAWSAFNKVYGQCSITDGSGGLFGGGGGGGGGWGGGGGSGGTPMSNGPGCVPECPDCKGGKPGG